MVDQALIFANLIKGVEVSQVAQDFNLSENEVNRIFSFVLRKVKSYAFERKMSIMVAKNIAEAQKYKISCLQILPKLNLLKEPKYKDIQYEIVTSDNMLAIARNLNT